MESRWTLDELIAEVAARLATAGVAQGSARVREAPDRRTVRYYTSLGLLDGPREFRGNVGLYGERQLWQLMAIKALQARGEPLASIQARLLGLSTARLRSLVGSPSPSPVAATTEPAAPVATGLHALPLADGASLILPARRPLAADDLEAIAAASAPLLRVLRARHLLP
jgi:DNA-binding transcriptional MerR regulator